MKKAVKKEDFFNENRQEINAKNAHMMEWISWCACLNMTVLSITGPFAEGFKSAWILYVVSAVLTFGFSLTCRLRPRNVQKHSTVLFYALITFICFYGISLGCFFYSSINSVTLIALFTLMPIVILDKSWRINVVMGCIYAVSCICHLLFKTPGLALEDIMTSGCFLVFSILIGNYFRKVQLDSINQKRVLLLQQELLREQRQIDQLTGLRNRWSLFETIKDEEIRIQGLAMFDIDNFKNYNDRFGHRAGDQCLQKVGNLLSEAENEDFKLFRYGGDEFLALYFGSGKEEMQKAIAELINMDCLDIPLDEKLSLSAGYFFRGRSQKVSVDRMISIADNALLIAKSHGKNLAVEGQS